MITLEILFDLHRKESKEWGLTDLEQDFAKQTTEIMKNNPQQNMEKLIIDIHRLRQRKIFDVVIRHALFDKEGDISLSFMLPEEKELYKKMLAILEEYNNALVITKKG